MKIVLVHNQYQFPGGEDMVFEQERRLLESHGHQVATYQRSNRELLAYTRLQRLNLPKQLVWAKDAHDEVLEILRKEKPQVVHVHNTFMQISPSIYSACRKAGVPVVQTLHNFRLLCPAANFFRDGKVCEECKETGLWRGVRYRCYHQSYGATAAVALMLVVHRRARTWVDDVNTYIALSRFARTKFAEGGLPADRITVKSNFVSPDPGSKKGAGEGAVFVGRLSPEKGVKTLLRAWGLRRSSVPLRIYGDGPQRVELEKMTTDLNLSGVAFYGQVNRDLVQSAIKNARLLILPSECYENFPMTIVEALSCGTPVLCSRLGAMQEIVTHQSNGLHFQPGNPEDLADKISWAFDHPTELAELGRAARQDYERNYTAEKNYTELMSIYDQAMHS